MVLDDKLAAGNVIVLDGATGTEIARLGGVMDGAAWCAVANLTHPDAVRQVHESYLNAGADLVTTNTFATCRHVLESVGLGDDTIAINRRAVTLAQEALENIAPARPVAIAGSMSTFMAPPPDEFTADPRFMPTAGQEIDNYTEMADTLAEAGCDLLIVEMLMDIEHSKRALRAAMATGLPVWVGLSCRRNAEGKLVGLYNMTQDERLAPTPPLDEMIDALAQLGPQVLGIMHSTVADTTPALSLLSSRWRGPRMAYPETALFESLARMPTITCEPAEFARQCRGWVESGVQIIGGCCGTTVEHIRAMVDALPEKPGPR